MRNFRPTWWLQKNKRERSSLFSYMNIA
jgi:hypothetical protein